jgi:hypothetical protein
MLSENFCRIGINFQSDFFIFFLMIALQFLQTRNFPIDVIFFHMKYNLPLITQPYLLSLVMYFFVNFNSLPIYSWIF